MSRLTNTLVELVCMPTVVGDREALAKGLDTVETWLSDIPLHRERVSHNGCESLVLTTQDTKCPRLWLAAHLDVVEGVPSLFVPTEKDGKLFGRGTYDMKFALACYVEFVHSRGQAVSNLDLGIMVTTDEERGGYNGTRHILEACGYHGGGAFLPDGGGPWSFEEGAKGMWGVKVRVEGISAHGSRPWLGRSANDVLVQVLSDIQARFARYDEQCTNELHWHPTVHTGIMRGGDAFNRLAGTAEAVLDIRYTSDDEYSEVAEALDLIIARYPHVTLETLHVEPVFSIERDHPLERVFSECAQTVAKRECGHSTSHGSSDARFFSRAGIPTLLITPHGGGAHSDHEWVDIADLERYYEVFCAFVDRVAKKQGL